MPSYSSGLAKKVGGNPPSFWLFVVLVFGATGICPVSGPSGGGNTPWPPCGCVCGPITFADRASKPSMPGASVK